MFSSLFSAIIYNPLYNGLIFFINHVPYADVGVAVILLTILVKVLLLPLAHTAIRSQVMMNAIKDELEAIRTKYKEDKQEQARQTIALYKERGINPFSMIVPLLVQIPVILGLYWVFLKGGLPTVDPSLLYSFISHPSEVNMHLFGLIDVSEKSLFLAVCAGISQYIHTRISFPKHTPNKSGPASFKDDLARSMQLQMRYVLPIIVGVIAYTISAAIALYWMTSNIFAIGQELFVRRRILKKFETNKQAV